MSPDFSTFILFYQYDFVVGLLQGFMINAHESGSNSPGRGLLAGICPKQSPCSAGILPGLCIWRFNIPAIPRPLGDMVANDWCITSHILSSSLELEILRVD